MILVSPIVSVIITTWILKQSYAVFKLPQLECENNHDAVLNCVTNISQIYTDGTDNVFISVDKQLKENICFMDIFMKHWNKQQISTLYLSNNKTIVEQEYNSKSSFYILFVKTYGYNQTIESLDMQIKYLKTYTEVWNSRGRFIIVLLDDTPTIALIQEVILHFWKKRILNLVVLTSSVLANTVNIFTAKPFSPNNCAKEVHPILLDQFVNGETRLIDSQNLFPLKIPKIFPNCSIKVSTSNEPPYTIKNPLNDSTLPYIDGIEINLINLIANVSGFSLIWMPAPESALRFGELLENGTWFGISGDVANEISDVAFASLRPTVTRFKACDLTNPYMVFSVAWFVPKAVRDHQWQIIVFGGYTWLGLVGSYVITSILLFYLNKFRYNNHPEHSTYSSLMSCFMKTLQIALGNTIINTPNSTKLRIVFFAWVVLQIHISTAYTSSLISLFTNPGYGKQIENLTDLKKSGFRVCMIPELELTKSKYSEYEVQYLFNRSFVCPDLGDAVKRLTTYKNFTLLANDNNIYFNSKHVLKDIHVLKDKLASFNVGMYLSKGSVYISSFNAVIKTAVEGGFVEKWQKDLSEVKASDDSNNKNDPIPLSIKMPYLSDVFYILFLGWFVSFTVFVLELASKRFNISPHFA